MVDPLPFSYRDLMRNATSFSGRLVVVDGVLFVEGESAYLVLDPEESRTRVSILDPDFIDRMLDNVPCYVGGRYLYQDAAKLQGVLSIEGRDQIGIRKISRVQISRGGETIEFGSSGSQ